MAQQGQQIGQVDPAENPIIIPVQGGGGGPLPLVIASNQQVTVATRLNDVDLTIPQIVENLAAAENRLAQLLGESIARLPTLDELNDNINLGDYPEIAPWAPPDNNNPVVPDANPAAPLAAFAQGVNPAVPLPTSSNSNEISMINNDVNLVYSTTPGVPNQNGYILLNPPAPAAAPAAFPPGTSPVLSDVERARARRRARASQSQLPPPPSASDRAIAPPNFPPPAGAAGPGGGGNPVNGPPPTPTVPLTQQQITTAITAIQDRIGGLNTALARELLTHQVEGGMVSTNGINQINIITGQIQELNLQLNDLIGQQRVVAAETARSAREAQEQMFWHQHLTQQGYLSESHNAIENMLSELRILLYRLIALGTPIEIINRILSSILQTASLAIRSLTSRELAYRFFVDCRERVFGVVRICYQGYVAVCQNSVSFGLATIAAYIASASTILSTQSVPSTLLVLYDSSWWGSFARLLASAGNAAQGVNLMASTWFYTHSSIGLVLAAYLLVRSYEHLSEETQGRVIRTIEKLRAFVNASLARLGNWMAISVSWGAAAVSRGAAMAWTQLHTNAYRRIIRLLAYLSQFTRERIIIPIGNSMIRPLTNGEGIPRDSVSSSFGSSTTSNSAMRQGIVAQYIPPNPPPPPPPPPAAMDVGDNNPAPNPGPQAPLPLNSTVPINPDANGGSLRVDLLENNAGAEQLASVVASQAVHDNTLIPADPAQVQAQAQTITDLQTAINQAPAGNGLANFQQTLLGGAVDSSLVTEYNVASLRPLDPLNGGQEAANLVEEQVAGLNNENNAAIDTELAALNQVEQPGAAENAEEINVGNMENDADIMENDAGNMENDDAGDQFNQFSPLDDDTGDTTVLTQAQEQAVVDAISTIIENPNSNSSSTVTFVLPSAGGGGRGDLGGSVTLAVPGIAEIRDNLASTNTDDSKRSRSTTTTDAVIQNIESLSAAAEPTVIINPPNNLTTIPNAEGNSRLARLGNVIANSWRRLLEMFRLTRPNVGGRRKSKRRLGSSNRRTKVRRGKKGGMKRRVTKKGIKHRYTKKVRKVSRPSTLARRTTQMQNQNQYQNQNQNQNQMQKQMQTQMQRQNQSQMKKMSKQQMQKLMMQRQMMQYSQQQQY